METENQAVELKKTLKSYNKAYYERNKEKILLNIKEKKLCTCCGKMVSLSNFSRHKKYNNCVSADDEINKKLQLKRKKITELNNYIKKMNELYDTDVKLFDLPN